MKRTASRVSHLRNIFDLSTWLPEYEDRWRYGAGRQSALRRGSALRVAPNRDAALRQARHRDCVALLRRPGSSILQRQGPSRRLARQ